MKLAEAVVAVAAVSMLAFGQATPQQQPRESGPGCSRPRRRVYPAFAVGYCFQRLDWVAN